MAIGRLFRRNRPPERAGTGPGSVTGRAPSGIHILSDADDWVPPEVSARPAPPDERATSPSDWLPPDLPEATSAPPPPSRKRSTVTEVPAELLAAARPEPSAGEMQAAIEEARRETERLRAEVEALRAQQAAAPAEPTGEAVNVNTATVDELMALPGMTRLAAQQLVEHREANGPFASLEALLDLPGFHAGRVEALGNRITV